MELATRLRRAVRGDGDGDARTGDDRCRCDPAFVERGGRAADAALIVDADGCPGEGDLIESADCRATAIGALAARDADVVLTRVGGFERAYAGDAAALLLAAGRFVERVSDRDRRLAARCRRNPLGAAREATGRAGPIARAAAETGLAEGAARADGYADALRPFVGPTLARSRLAPPPRDAALADRRTLPTGATVRVYATTDGRRTYHLRPTERAFDRGALATLDAARDALGDGAVGGGDRAPGRAVRRVADADDPIEALSAALAKHTRGNGVFDDLFADPRLTDAFVTAPVEENPVRVVVDGERLPTNVRLTPDGAAALASRFRRESGRAFSRASPTLDAVVDSPAAAGRVRVAGVAEPASDGLGFAFRRHDGGAFTLPRLIADGALTAEAAALCSLSVERASAGLIAGGRGAGKTTLLGALLWELPDACRTVVIEDTPELPVDALRERGRDVQPLRVGVDGDGAEIDPEEALRTALRLGEGALVVGEVRGAEAATLYEAMRVGAAADAVLGTIHGDGGEAVRERVVSDLGVPESSFAATDLLITLDAADRHVDRIEEVRATDGGATFEPLYAREGDRLAPAGAVDRGDSALVASLARPGEGYADALAALDDRASELAALAGADRVDPTDVAEVYAAERR